MHHRDSSIWSCVEHLSVLHDEEFMLLSWGGTPSAVGVDQLASQRSALILLPLRSQGLYDNMRCCDPGLLRSWLSGG